MYGSSWMNTFNYPFTKRASRRKRNRYRLCEISVATLDNKATNKISTNFKFPSTNYKSGKSEIFRMQIFRVERRTRDFENKRTREFDRDDSAARRNNFCPPSTLRAILDGDPISATILSLSRERLGAPLLYIGYGARREGESNFRWLIQRT